MANTAHNNMKAEGLSIYKDGIDTGKKTSSTFDLLVGNYNISLQQPDYQNVSENVIVREKSNEMVTFNVESLSWYRSEVKKWRKHSMIGLASTSIFIGCGVYCNMQANDNLDKYNSTAITSAALDNKQKAQDFENYRDYCYYAASGAVVYTLYSWIKTAIYNGKLKK
jgi:hypothetical protein